MIDIREPELDEIKQAFLLIKENMEPYLNGRGENWNEDAIRRYFQSKQNYVLIKDKKLCGFMSIEIENKSVFIHTLQVLIYFQNRMVGYHALKWLVKYVMTNGCVCLRCGIFVNNPVLRIYEKLGFEKQALNSGVYKLELSLTNKSIRPLMRRMIYKGNSIRS